MSRSAKASDPKDNPQKMIIPIKVQPSESVTSFNIVVTAPEKIDVPSADNDGKQWYWRFLLSPWFAVGIMIILAALAGFLMFRKVDAMTIMLLVAFALSIASPAKAALDNADPQKPCYKNWIALTAVLEKAAVIVAAAIALMKYLGNA
ncbi:hypothetical protein [Bifidobacterium aquikefiri]|uniref:hypothetical protein n=1 Tax=Bifidobacterium aquikefiri TaxID=1653207 RepID=UPI0023F2C3FA|nr:hypothetical protein [Bifidobacterium aquikefiri]